MPNTRKPTSDRRRCKKCNRWAQFGSEYCWDHDPTVSDEEKHAARVRGGKASRKVHPLALDEIEDIADTTDLKRFTVSVIKGLVAGTVKPNQARALFTGGKVLKDVMELQLYEQLAERVSALEGDTAKRLESNGEWQISDRS